MGEGISPIDLVDSNEARAIPLDQPGTVSQRPDPMVTGMPPVMPTDKRDPKCPQQRTCEDCRHCVPDWRKGEKDVDDPEDLLSLLFGF